MQLQDIRKIYLYGRGASRDESGNPYYAYRAIIDLKHSKERIELSMSMDWGSSDKGDVFVWFQNQFKKWFGIELGWQDLKNGLVEYEYTHVKPSEHDRLRNPENWKIDI